MDRVLPQPFLRWLLDLPQRVAIVGKDGREVHLPFSSSVSAGGPPNPVGDLALAGGEPAIGRRAALAVGVLREGGSSALWLYIPVEPENPDELFLVLIRLGAAEAPPAGIAKLDAALAKQSLRHGINQPLTAITFLLENLFFAALKGNPEPGYLQRKQQQMLEQVGRLQAILAACGVLGTEA